MHFYACCILLTCLVACITGGEVGKPRHDWCQTCQGAGKGVGENADHIHLSVICQFALAHPFVCCKQASRIAECLSQVVTEPVSKQVGVGRGIEGNVPLMSGLASLAQRRCERMSDLGLFVGK